MKIGVYEKRTMLEDLILLAKGMVVFALIIAAWLLVWSPYLILAYLPTKFGFALAIAIYPTIWLLYRLGTDAYDKHKRG